MIIDANDSLLGPWHTSDNEKDFYYGLIRLSVTWGFSLPNLNFLDIEKNIFTKEEYTTIGNTAVSYLNSITKNGYKFKIENYILLLEDDPFLNKKELKNRKNKRKLEDKNFAKLAEKQKKEFKKLMKNSRPWELLNPNVKHVPEDVYNKRYEICKNCEFFIKKTKQCKKCMCFMNLKCVLPNSFCPENKWQAYIEEKDK